MRTIEAYSYGCVMLELPKALADKVMAISAAIPDDDIYDDGDGTGREDQPHVTVKYGLHTADPKKVRKVLEGRPPVSAELGAMSIFHNEDYAVLKIGVRSPDLVKLHRLISKNLECTESHPVYHPHVTVAYLKHRADDPYWYRDLYDDNLDGEQFESDTLLFSTADDDDYDVKLKGMDTANVAERVARKFIAMPHFIVDCGGKRTPVDMCIELYGTGKLDPKYERLLEKYFKTTDKREMMRKALKMKIVPVQCPRGVIELVEKDSGRMIKKVARGPVCRTNP